MLANLSITSKSNQLQEKRAGAFIFEETKETKFLTHCSQKKKKKKKLNDTLSGGSETNVPNVQKRSWRMKLRVKFQAEDLHRTYSRYFQTNLLF